MRSALVVATLFLAVACNQKSSSTPPDAGNAPPPASDDGNAGTDAALDGIDGGTKPASDPTGAECVAKCLEGDTHKDLDFDAREAACKAECPAPEASPDEG